MRKMHGPELRERVVFSRQFVSRDFKVGTSLQVDRHGATPTLQQSCEHLELRKIRGVTLWMRGFSG